MSMKAGAADETSIMVSGRNEHNGHSLAATEIEARMNPVLIEKKDK